MLPENPEVAVVSALPLEGLRVEVGVDSLQNLDTVGDGSR